MQKPPSQVTLIQCSIEKLELLSNVGSVYNDKFLQEFFDVFKENPLIEWLQKLTNGKHEYDTLIVSDMSCKVYMH